MSIPLIVLLLVFILIAVRRIGSVHLEIWQIMLGGAIIVLLTGQIAPLDALRAINLDVMLFLFGMFVVGQALEESGYLEYLAYRLFCRARSADQLLLLALLIMGLGAALLMNDTLAIIGTPVMLCLARNHRLPGKAMLLALAFAVTIGSVTSPIGNPQNLLIAINGNVENSFVVFLRYLLLPTLINLLAAFALIKLGYRKQLHAEPLCHDCGPLKDVRLARLCQVSLVLIVLLILAKIAIVSLQIAFDFRLIYIALVATLPILLFSPRRAQIIRRIDWATLVFFAAMFVLMESVWETGMIQQVIGRLGIDITATPAILGIGIALSQIISNVPLVALYLPMLMQAGASTKSLMALAAGSTIAGNMFILGAASNVIIIHNAEKKAGETLTFWEFARIGLPLTAINALVYWLFLSF
jgi:Na+/H+ antiporter NhaD/arsenite permease-like protein